MSQGVVFNQDTARRMLAMLRAFEAGNIRPGKGRDIYREGEQYVTGTANGAVTTLGNNTNNFTPDYPASADDLQYLADFAYIADNAVFPLVWDQRTENYTIPIVQEILECVLTASLSHGSSATATITKCDGTAGDTITVYDNNAIGAGFHLASGSKIAAYYSLCHKYYLLRGPCRVAD